MMTRRQALKTTALAGAAFAILPRANSQTGSPAPNAPGIVGVFTLPPLPYPFDALEPHIDAQTMQIHHDKHHAAYVANLNKAVTGWTDYLTRMNAPSLQGLEILLKDLNSVPENIRTAVRNNGGGHYNHSLFWQMMKKNGDGEPKGELAKAIDDRFKSFSAFKDEFAKAALGQFGSGWAWLVLNPADKSLSIESTPNQDSPLSAGKRPLLGLDVWEHAYYLKYQNRRADYITAWWNTVDWDFVSNRFAEATRV